MKHWEEKMIIGAIAGTVVLAVASFFISDRPAEPELPPGTIEDISEPVEMEGKEEPTSAPIPRERDVVVTHPDGDWRTFVPEGGGYFVHLVFEGGLVNYMPPDTHASSVAVSYLHEDGLAPGGESVVPPPLVFAVFERPDGSLRSWYQNHGIHAKPSGCSVHLIDNKYGSEFAFAEPCTIGPSIRYFVFPMRTHIIQVESWGNTELEEFVIPAFIQNFFEPRRAVEGSFSSMSFPSDADILVSAGRSTPIELPAGSGQRGWRTEYHVYAKPIEPEPIRRSEVDTTIGWPDLLIRFYGGVGEPDLEAWFQPDAVGTIERVTPPELGADLQLLEYSIANFSRFLYEKESEVVEFLTDESPPQWIRNLITELVDSYIFDPPRDFAHELEPGERLWEVTGMDGRWIAYSIWLGEGDGFEMTVSGPGCEFMQQGSGSALSFNPTSKYLIYTGSDDGFFTGLYVLDLETCGPGERVTNAGIEGFDPAHPDYIELPGQPTDIAWDGPIASYEIYDEGIVRVNVETLEAAYDPFIEP